MCVLALCSQNIDVRSTAADPLKGLFAIWYLRISVFMYFCIDVALCVCSSVPLYRSLVACHLSLVAAHLPLVACDLARVACPLSLVACHLLLVTCDLSLVTCHFRCPQAYPTRTRDLNILGHGLWPRLMAISYICFCYLLTIVKKNT